MLIVLELGFKFVFLDGDFPIMRNQGSCCELSKINEAYFFFTMSSNHSICFYHYEYFFFYKKRTFRVVYGNFIVISYFFYFHRLKLIYHSQHMPMLVDGMI